MLEPIIYACTILALLAAGALRVLGLSWWLALCTAAILAAGIGWSALDVAGTL